MASLVTINESGLTVYLILRDVDSQVWNTDIQDFEAYNPANYTDYDLPAAEQGDTGYYYAGTPAGLDEAYYRFDWREQAGGAPAVTDLCIASGSAYWDGTLWGTSPAAPASVVADAVADEVLDGFHEVPGSLSVLLQTAAEAGDPLSNPVPGTYPAGSAGEALGMIPAISTMLAFSIIQYSPTTVDTTMGSPFELTVGTLIRCTAIFTDPLNGDIPIDPDAVYFSYRSPDGVSTTLQYGVDPEVFRDSQGRYHYDLLLTQPRIWYYSFWSPGPDGRAITEATVEVKPGLIEHP